MHRLVPFFFPADFLLAARLKSRRRALALLCCLLAFLPALPVGAQTTNPSIALHYGAEPPLDELQAFDIAVVEPDHLTDPAALPRRHTQWFAYVSVVEMQPSRAYFNDIPAAWLRGDNRTWGSRLIDQTSAGWPAFFAQRVIGPLWQQGYRGFFLDTLDSYHLFAKTPNEKRAQEDALVVLIEQLHRQFPGIQLIFNRGFEVLPRLKGRVFAVAAESLFQGWDHAAQQYREVPAADREWLLSQMTRVRQEHSVPALIIDYVAPGQRVLARATAQRIRALGFVPWITNGAIDLLGMGDIEVQPRRVALITDKPDDTDFQNSTAVRFLSMPLHYLGYTIDPIDVRESLPAQLDPGRYAAIVTWFSQPVAPLNARFHEWLEQQLDRGLRLVMLNDAGIEPDSSVAQRLGLVQVAQPSGMLKVDTRDALIGFETQPLLDGRSVAPLQLNPAARHTPLLRLRSANNTVIDSVALTSWGGFALDPFAVQLSPINGTARWIVHPIEFLRRALTPADAVPFPVPDVATEAGHRLLLIHIDGDGFVSRAERAGSPFAGEVLLRDVFERYRLPTTMSIIQGEIAGNGMFRELAPELEAIARRMFALPHIELASHSYSHPFFWSKLQGGVDADKYPKALNLLLPGYRFDLRAEIPGSLDYINTRLAPPGKRAEVFLWTGDTVPTTEAVALATASGVLNMNGGDTLITRSNPSLTVVSGLGLRRGNYLQVFAPNQNENVYTNNWTGPYYGFQRVIETFELTEQPLRLKPINIYYHTYSATKAASLNALHRIYRYALEQPTVPVYASDYIRKVIDFHSLVIARDWRGEKPTWRVRTGGQLRTLRVPQPQSVSLARSAAVAGAADGPGSARYLHLSAPAAEIVFDQDSSAPPSVAHAQGWLSDFARSADGVTFALWSYTQASFTLANAARCTVRGDGKAINPAPASPRNDALTRYELPPGPVTTTPRRVVVDVRCPR